MIKLLQNYPYDNKYDYVKLFSSKSEQTNFFSKYISETIKIDNDETYIKEGDSFIIEYEYDYLVNENINYLIYDNGYKDLYCFIVKKEYVDDVNTRIYYEIDVLNTYLFDFNLNTSFIERKVCNINEICDYDEGLVIGEHNIVSSTTAYTKEEYFFAMFSGFREDYPIKDRDNNITNIVNTTYNISRPVTTVDGVKYPITFMPLGSYNASILSTYLMDAPNLLGIIVFPKCTYNEEIITVPVLTKSEAGFESKDIQLVVSSNISSLDITGGSVSVPKGELTDFYPYTYYVLTDGETEPLIMKPQHCQSSITVKGKTALSHTPVQRFYPSYYKGDTTGNVYNITNSSICTLPTGGNSGLAQYSTSASQIAHSNTSGIINTLSALGTTAMSGLSGNVAGVVGGVSATASGINSIVENMKRIEDMELTPSSIKTYGTPSTRHNFNTNTVKILKYSIEEKYKNRIKNFVDRYGNKFNNYGNVNLRNYKGYIKFNAPDLDATFDNMYVQKVISILERGVYIE